MIIVHEMTSCSGAWFACYYGGKKLPVACWALVQESGAKAIIGLVSGSQDAALIPADNVPDFIEYKKRRI